MNNVAPISTSDYYYYYYYYLIIIKTEDNFYSLCVITVCSETIF